MEGGFLIMKGKAVLKALLFAYGVTGMLLLFLAFLLFQFNLGEGTGRLHRQIQFRLQY